MRLNNAMIINKKDNVIVAIEPIKKDTEVCFLVDGQEERLIALDDIPMYHKIARENIEIGNSVIKYGEYIGEAGQDIKKGSYAHVHNILSARKKTID